MADKRWYPIFLDVEGRAVLVVGGGNVAMRKARGLLEAGARVTVVAPVIAPAFENLRLTLLARPFEDTDLEGAHLVFAATNSREVNRRIGLLARERGIPANIADAPAECGFIVPARINREGLQVAISTGGDDPARAAKMRQRLEEWLDRGGPYETMKSSE
jgi:siroheme synthase-like protein